MVFDEFPLTDTPEFREVLALDEERLRELLGDANPRYRIWAAWALGLKLGDRFRMTALDLLAHEPVGGVRRHLVVMIAGYAEIDVLAHLARHDADEYVRATAAQYVAELSEVHPVLLDVVRATLVDPARRVRCAAATHVPRTLRAQLEPLVSAVLRAERPRQVSTYVVDPDRDRFLPSVVES